VIARALDDLPDSVPADVTPRAEAHLVAQARDFAPRDLRILGRRVLDVVAPDVADAEEARQLAAEEAHAYAHTSLTMRPRGDGTTQIDLRVPDLTASRLTTYLQAYTSPRHDPSTPAPAADRIPHHQQLGQAFCSMLEAIDPTRLPLHGGDATTLVVTIGLERLLADLDAATTGVVPAGDVAGASGAAGAARLGDGAAGAVGVARLADGGRITAGEARRLACTAGILPAVLGGDSEVLDLGRRRRLFTPAQRKAMRMRDQQCRAEGCTIPATWCEAHHLTPWSTGGNTDLDDGVLLCSHHHHRAHDPAYRTDRLPNGDLRYHRRN
jgi:hypothetical protein